MMLRNATQNGVMVMLIQKNVKTQEIKGTELTI